MERLGLLKRRNQKITKTQIKNKIRKIKNLIEDLLQNIEEARDDIEPHGDYDELTPKQEIYCEWLDDVSDYFDQLIDDLEEYYE